MINVTYRMQNEDKTFDVVKTVHCPHFSQATNVKSDVINETKTNELEEQDEDSKFLPLQQQEVKKQISDKKNNEKYNPRSKSAKTDSLPTEEEEEFHEEDSKQISNLIENQKNK